MTWRRLACPQLTSPSCLNTPSLAPLPERLQAPSASLLSWPQIKCPLPSGSPTRKLVICPVPSPAHSHFQQMHGDRTKKCPVMSGSRTWTLHGCTLCLGSGRGGDPGSRLGERGFQRPACTPAVPLAPCSCVSLFLLQDYLDALTGICYDGLEGLLYLGLFSLLAALAFSIMICLGPGAWKHCATRWAPWGRGRETLLSS